MHRSMRRREEIGASRQTRAAQTPPADPTAAGGRIRPRLRAEGRTAAPALPRRAGARRTAGLAPAMDETRNCGEINRELLLRPEAEAVLARPSGAAGRPPDLCESYNRRRLTRTGGHTAEPRRGRRRAALRSWLPTSCLRTTGVPDRREAGRPGWCYRPNPLAPIRVCVR